MAETLVAKLLRTHLVGGSLAPSEEVQLRVDQVLLEDYTGTMACLQFEALAVDRIQVPFAIQYVDHNVLQLDWKDQGLVPLTFADEADYDGVRQGDQWEIVDLHGILERGEDEWRVRIAGTGKGLRLRAKFTPERQILLAGGLLAYARATG